MTKLKTATTPRRAFALTLVTLMLASLLAAPTAPASADDSMVNVIVRTIDGLAITPAIELMGGTVTGSMSAIDSITAEVPTSSVGSIEAIPGVLSVTQDISVQLSGGGWDEGSKDTNTVKEIGQIVDDNFAQAAGHTGQGVTVALIDSGVAPVPGLDGAGKIINGPDLSFDSQIDGMQHIDAYGHGTHMAGIIAGDAGKAFEGIAPDASILNVKVGAANGAVDVSQVLAGINWVIEHRNDNGMNVRVLNLSFGTDSTESYLIDPLSYAVEVAWRKGIVVVVAAGNDSNNSALRSPATNPYVIAVGAADTNGSNKAADDFVPAWSNCGTKRNVDVVAPGVSIASLRVPGSYADTHYPLARVGDNLFKGSGTSQAAAAVSGVAALIIDAHPDFTPDQVKAAITKTANPISGTSDCVGSGIVSAQAVGASVGEVYQSFRSATGTGSLEAARGSDHLIADGVALQGEIDIFGQAFDSSTWTGSTWTGSTWTGGDWNGSTWTGSTWSGSTWTGSTWTGSTWTGSTWTGSTWTDAYWTGSTWTGSTWTGSTWTGSTWTGKNWTGLTWDHGKRIR